METKRNLTGEGSQGDSIHDTNGTSPTSYMDEISSLPVSQPHPSVPPQQKYAMPPPQQNQRPISNNYYSGGGDTNSSHHPSGPMVTSPQHQNVMMTHGNSSSPYSSRGAPTVVYSSDGAGKKEHAFHFILKFISFCSV